MNPHYTDEARQTKRKQQKKPQTGIIEREREGENIF